MANDKFQETDCDVLILGGGLAGLTLALQLHTEVPSARVIILERVIEPPKASAHKVGESSVEVFADYLAEKLDLREHLETEHLPKLGLRFFFPDFTPTALEDRVEMGSKEHPPFRTYQIDRGILENELMDRVSKSNASLRKGHRAREVELNSGAPHIVRYENSEDAGTISARWLVDCTGRSSFLAKKTERISPAEHDHSAIWFRIDEVITPDDWISDPEWTADYQGKNARRFSTNHFIGDGFWIWLIPLPEDRTSIGLCLDPAFVDLSQVNSFGKFVSFLKEREPLLFEALAGKEAKIMDFCAIKKYPKKVDTICSSDRWAIIGDAGSFVDPLYSFGNDFIAIGNSITTELIRLDMAGESFALEAEFLNAVYLDFINQTFPVFQGTYKILESPLIGQVKIAWDFAVYWTLIASFSVHSCINKIEMYIKMNPALQEMRVLNQSVTALLNYWYDQDKASMKQHFSSIYNFPWIGPINFSLCSPCSLEEFAPVFDENLKACRNLLSDMLGLMELRGVAVPDLDFKGCTPSKPGENELIKRFGHLLA